MLLRGDCGLELPLEFRIVGSGAKIRIFLQGHFILAYLVRLGRTLLGLFLTLALHECRVLNSGAAGLGNLCRLGHGALNGGALVLGRLCRWVHGVEAIVLGRLCRWARGGGAIVLGRLCRLGTRD